MGYTHFDKVCGVNGVFVGAKGSEVQMNSGAIPLNIAAASTAAVTIYTVAPAAGTISGYAVFSVSAGTARSVTVTAGSAGAELLTTGTLGVTGTIGAVQTMSNTSGTTTVSAGDSLKVTLASCATAQVQVGVTLAITP